MINIKKYIVSYIYKYKTIIICDNDFWGCVRLIDLEDDK